MILAMLGLLFWFVVPSSIDDSLNADDLPKSVIQKGAGGSWYDKSTENFRVPDPNSIRRTDLEERSRSIYKPAPATNWRWNFGFGGTFAKVIAYILLALAIGLLIGGLIYLINSERSLSGGRRKKGSQIEGGIDQARLSDLPLVIEHTEKTPFEEADLAQRSGDYSRAIVFLYIHMLLELDQAKRIRLQRGKTNGMYLRELRGHQTLRSSLQKVSLAFEWVYFGKHTLSETAFRKCWDLLPSWQEELRATNQATAPTTTVGAVTS